MANRFISNRKGYYFNFCDKLKLTDKQTKRLIYLIMLGLKTNEIYAIINNWIKENEKDKEIIIYKKQIQNFLYNLRAYHLKYGAYKYQKKRDE